MVKHSWTEKEIQTVKEMLGRFHSVGEAAGPISAKLGFRCSVTMIRNVLNHHGISPNTVTGKNLPSNTLEPSENLKSLYQLLKKRPYRFSELCDKLDVAPSRVRALLKEAESFGVLLNVEHDHISVPTNVLDERVQNTGISPVVGKRQTIAVITDTHLGSKYCLRPQLRDFIEYAYEQGAREICHVGDILDGDYRHGKFEMSHMGIEEQTRDLYEVLPKKKGLTYHAITGNHDFTFTEESGVNVGRYISDYFNKRGRQDFFAYGDRGATIRIRGATVCFWHPSGGVSYALSYKMQKKIESFSSGEKPSILLIGHWHRFAYIVERGVHAVAGGTFQGGGSAFSKSLTSGAPAIGGTVIHWNLTKERTLRDVIIDRRSYFEVEQPKEIENRG